MYATPLPTARYSATTVLLLLLLSTTILACGLLLWRRPSSTFYTIHILLLSILLAQCSPSHKIQKIPLTIDTSASSTRGETTCQNVI